MENLTPSYSIPALDDSRCKRFVTDFRYCFFSSNPSQLPLGLRPLFVLFRLKAYLCRARVSVTDIYSPGWYHVVPCLLTFDSVTRLALIVANSEVSHAGPSFVSYIVFIFLSSSFVMINDIRVSVRSRRLQQRTAWSTRQWLPSRPVWKCCPELSARNH